MKRAILAVIIFLLLGAGTSIALAWAAVLSVGDEGLQDQFGSCDEEQGWIALVQRSPWCTMIDADRADAPGTASITLRDLGWPGPRPAPSWSMLNRGGATGFLRIREAASGWPMLCLKCTRVAEKLGWVEEWDLENHGALVGLAPWRARSMDPADVRCLPLLPMFAGMAVDTLLFATAWLIAFSGIHAFRWWRAAARRRAHLCPRCAYRLEPSGSERCPECGAESTYRPPLIGPRRLAAAAIALLLLALALAAFAMVFHARRPYRALHHAAYTGDVKAVEKLLAQGVDVEGSMTYTVFSAASATSASPFTDDVRWTGLRPLMLAANAGDVPTVRCLLDAGAFVDMMDDRGLTALHYACGASNHAVIDELIARGADLNANAPRTTPLCMAALQGDLIALEQLAEAGADVVGDDRAFAMAVWRGDRVFVEALLRRGAEVTGEVMARAVYKADAEMIDLLIEHGGDLRQRTEDGSTMLFHVPCREEVRPLWERIINAGVDVNAVNNTGETALIYRAGCIPELVEFLLEHGADPTIRNAAGEMALDWAVSEEVRELLRRAVEESGESSDER